MINEIRMSDTRFFNNMDMKDKNNRCKESFHPIKEVYRRKITSFLFLILATFPTIWIQAQHTTRNNYTGSWETSTSWSPAWTTPALTGLSTDITINGFITANGPVSFTGSGGNLIVNDTLVILGDLTLSNNSNISVGDAGVLIVRGNLSVDNQVDIAANAYIIVTGNFTKTGAANQGSFTSNDFPANVYIGGTIDVPGGWASTGSSDVLNCSLPNEHTSSQCNYGNYVDLLNNPINNFFQAAIKDLDSDNDGIPDATENTPCNTPPTELFTNGTFEAGNTGFISDYAYRPSDGYPEGVYTVATNPKAWHNSFSPCGDATTGSGKMMIINASGTLNAVVWSSGTIAIQPYKTYTLSLKLASVHPTSPAQLIFRINGVNIGAQFNATSTTCQWVSVQATWYSGNATSAKFDIINLNTTASGNDFALDNISCTYIADCDSDGDGIPDKFDLDSDNDGIYDILEAGGTDANNDGLVDNSTDADNDGLADVYDNINSGHGASEVTSGTPLTNPDTDADGKVDRIDLDSDGDACFDAAEAGFSDPNADGKLGGSPVAVDTQGKVTGSGGYTTPANLDNAGGYDFLQKGPAIAVQPSNRNVCLTTASSTSFSVTATGVGSYQWQVSTNNGSSWTNLTNGGIYSNVTTATLNLTGVTVAYDKYLYRVLLSHPAYICSPIISGSATLRVHSTPPNTPGAISGYSISCPSTSSAYSITVDPNVVTYNWSLPTGWTITSGAGTNSITVMSGSSGQNGNITVSGTNSCGTSTASTLSVSSTVPAPSFISAAGANTCASSSVTYSTQSGKYNYIWSIPGVQGTDYTITSGGTTTSDYTVTLTWLTTGSKTVTVNYSQGGCSGVTPASSTTSVNALPSPSFTAQPGSNACLNTDVTYTTQAGQSNYIWNVPGILGSDYSITSGGTGTSSNTVTLKWLSTGNKTITINYTNTLGCTAAIATTSASTSVNPNPSATINPATPATCAGVGLSLTATPSGGSGTYSTHAWTGTGSSSLNSTSISNPTFTNSTGGAYALTYTVTDNKGCSGTATTSVTVHALPSISINLSEISGTVANDGTICKGDPIKLTASGGNSYSWNSGETTAIINVTPVITTSYTVTGTDSNSCSNTANQTVTVVPRPTSGELYNKPNN